MMDMYQKTNRQILKAIGEQIKNARLSQDIKQQELAAKADIGESTLARLEKGEGCNLDKLITVLRALGRLDDLNPIIAPPDLSPVKIAETTLKVKSRSRASSRPHRPQDSSAKKEGGSEKPAWRWGDEKQ